MRDVVCKMELDEKHLKEALVYEGRSYYFCSVGCRAEFERHTDEYVECGDFDKGVNEDV